MPAVGKLDSVVIDGATLYYTSTAITDPKTNLATITADYLGCAKSSISVVAKPNIRAIEHMGKMERKTNYDERITSWEVSCEADILDVNSKTLGASLMVKDTVTPPTGHDRYILKTGALATGDYKNLVIVGTQQGTTEKVVCVIKNTYNGEGMSLEFKDNDESAAKMKFIGSYEVDSMKAPFELYRQKEV